MILSMTGYGRVSRNYRDKTIIVEIRSLNSKFTDLRFKAPQHYKEKEPEIRKILTERLERGKIDFTLEIISSTGEDGFALNVPLFKRYIVELRELSAELKVETGDLLQAVLRLPNVVASANDQIEEKEWENVSAAIEEAIQQFELFRASEGKVLGDELRSRVVLIQDNLEKVGPLEGERVVRMRQRLYQNLEESLGKEKIDENRFEQEIIHYLEKLDITEEKVRLAQHCKYFIEELTQPGNQKGRKLSFISQEIGREINTLGAKAYSSDIQRLVVVMKDELEKIKEQVANCL
ncbi:MAG TPA: YicC family protein [Haliscomenobacter sp.]|uniref:YicC/YloC family endoribonuclease n=1 Tax=Haliscomenobacter sp. TaxID=2717303 RepID=UPI002D186B28|nr:YicC/YloC family endoribonuclease [Haliscomenobacter sp.]HOY18925.1 YicC family protein [Haliscomenobacter sp.]HPH21199.1 YicC family protein [Haliscomenobacter sp.]